MCISIKEENILRTRQSHNLIKPENYKGERMFYSYTYDDLYHSLVTKVSDAYGYSSTTTYDG